MLALSQNHGEDRNSIWPNNLAPKEFELWGLSHYSLRAEKGLLLQGTYRVNSLNNIQEFSVPKTKMQLYSLVLLEIKSNHGNPNLMCLYRV
ncbi:hypothetical protein PSHT_15854 [Puccinia striiformis]|uniref:SUN domain-containing protein n=1 Tax=Puccinia striiformis TaxID=27350 RepID=A0A2S4UCT7_9BASI|nr:hypothetical protein PSHT_15854 [Puccinia striiformis]